MKGHVFSRLALGALVVAVSFAAHAAPPQSVVKQITGVNGSAFQEGVNDGSIDTSTGRARVVPEFNCDATQHKCSVVPDTLSGIGALLSNNLSDIPDKAAALNTLNGLSRAGGAMSGGLQVPSLVFSGLPALSHLPTGNPVLTYGSQVLQVYTGKPSNREIGLSLGMTSNLGSAVTDPQSSDGDKITLYSGMVCLDGSRNCFAQNSLLTIDANNTSSQGNWINEEDINVMNHDFGDAPGIPGEATPLAWGHQVVSGGTHRATAAYSLTSLNAAGVFNRGYLCQVQSVAHNCFEDHSTSDTASYEDFGTHPYGVDLRYGHYASGALRLPNDSGILTRSSDDTHDIVMMYVDTAGLLHLQGDIAIRDENPEIAKDYTVASLPACNATLRFARAVVTDLAAAPSWGQQQSSFAGGGGNAAPVFCNNVGAWEVR